MKTGIHFHEETFICQLLSILSIQMNIMKNLAVVVIFALFLTSCDKKPNLKDYMASSWETTYVKIEMPTYQQQDSTNVFEDDFKNNPPRIARSKYNEDGTFIAWYVTPIGEIMGETPGTWSVVGDSLYIAYNYEGRNSAIAYHVKMTEEGFDARSKHDWDVDGEFDDILFMKTKRIILEEE